MYLKLTTANWDSLRFVVSRKQNDYQYLEKDDIGIFIYGYPFNAYTDSWISPDDVYQLYFRSGLDFSNDIEGVYTIIILDKIKNKCFVITDRYGVYSLFYLKTQDYILLSDVISEITTHIGDITLKKGSIIEYLNFGFKLGNKTHIEGIHEFESSRIYEINSELEMTESIYWEYQSKSEEDRMTKDEFLKVFNAHVATAMSLSEKVCLPLTSGLDTRTILSASITKKERLHCYTHSVKNHIDETVAQAICRDFGISHSFYELNEGWIKTIPSMLEKNAEIFNGLTPAVTFMHVERSYIEEDTKEATFISGVLANEAWRCFLGEIALNSTNINELSMAITKLYTDVNPDATDIYHGYGKKEVINLLRDSLKTELLRSKNAKDLVALSEAFAFKNYCSNWASNSLKATGKHFKLFVAFLHKDLLQQIPLMSLVEKTNGSIQKYIIAKNNLRFGPKGYMRLLPIRARLAMNIISRRILKRDVFRFPYFTDYPGWLRNYHKQFILEILEYEKLVTKELFKKQELEKTVNAYLDGDNSLTRFVVALISLEIWLKRISKEKGVTIRG